MGQTTRKQVDKSIFLIKKVKHVNQNTTCFIKRPVLFLRLSSKGLFFRIWIQKV
ncbi:hypothetical protein HanRHA438_Chr10g0467651 [Helianthus annuus]|nr:hypothetical protein HanRHA438_Chr10g0467651 [Helianthus annuus]